MFKAYDVSNHAGLLRGMDRRSLGGPESAPPSLLSAQQGLQDYLAKPFKVPAKDSPDAALFAQAVLFAQSDATVKSYFVKLQAALKHKIASLKQQGFADTDQAALDALPKRITVAQDAVDKSNRELDKALDAVDAAFNVFIDWIQQSYRLAVQNHLYTEAYALHVSSDVGIIDAFNGSPYGFPLSVPEQLNAALYNLKTPLGTPSVMLTKPALAMTLGFWTGTYNNSFRNNTTYFGNGPILQPLPTDPLPPVMDGNKVMRSGLRKGGKRTIVEPKKVQVLNTDETVWVSKKLPWVYAPLADLHTQLRYTGSSATREGFMAAYSWNENFIPKLKGAIALYNQMLANTKMVQDLQASLTSLTQAVADEKAAAQAEQAAYEKGLAEANAVKAKLSGFLLGYADTLGEQYTKAAELNGLTKAREAMQAQNAKWFADYDAMTKQGNALIAQAEAETDAGRKAALRIEGARRLGRALEMNARGQSLRDGALKRYGERRSGAAKGLADAQAATGLTLPAVSQAQVQADTAKIAELNAKIAEIQAAANATKQEIIDGLSKLPSEFQPPNTPPKVEEKPKGGAGWILALGAAGAAFIAYKRGH